MLKIKLFVIALILYGWSLYSQNDKEFTTIELVTILNDNKTEALFYYENNWKQLREAALKKGYIEHYKLLTVIDTNSKADIILQTVYKNEDQFINREEHFKELIDAHGALRLLNKKQPNEFRKSLFWSDSKAH